MTPLKTTAIHSTHTLMFSTCLAGRQVCPCVFLPNSVHCEPACGKDRRNGVQRGNLPLTILPALIIKILVICLPWQSLLITHYSSLITHFSLPTAAAHFPPLSCPEIGLSPRSFPAPLMPHFVRTCQDGASTIPLCTSATTPLHHTLLAFSPFTPASGQLVPLFILAFLTFISL